jgi:hypothetical protein
MKRHLMIAALFLLLAAPAWSRHPEIRPDYRVGILAQELEQATYDAYYLVKREGRPYGHRDHRADRVLRDLNHRARDFNRALRHARDPYRAEGAYRALVETYRYAVDITYRARHSRYVYHALKRVESLMNELHHAYRRDAWDRYPRYRPGHGRIDHREHHGRVEFYLPRFGISFGW